MTEHMSAAEYKKLMVNPALKEESDDQEFLKRLRGASDQSNNIPRSKSIITHSRVGAAIYDRNGKLQEFVGEWLPTKKERKHEEDDLTKQVADYCEVLLLQKKITAFSHIPQETFTKSWVTKGKNKAMGVRSGVPDMLIVYPHAVLFLELKKEKGGKLSDSQALWIKALSSTGMVTAVVAAGWDQAEAAINSLLE